MVRCFLTLVFAGLFFCSGVFQNSFAGVPSDMELELERVVGCYFRLSELSLKQNAEEANKAADELSAAVESVASDIISGITDLSSLKLLEFSELYQKLSQDEAKKPALDMVVEPVLEHLLALQFTGNSRSLKSRDDLTREYFPGYGYTESGYIYKLGKEISSETVNQFWRDEEKTWEQEIHVECTLDLSLAAELKPKVKNWKASAPFEMNIGGHITLVVKASFDTKSTIKTTTRRKYAVRKVWFELYRASVWYWVTPNWELVGKTYKFFEEPGYEEVVVGVTPVVQNARNENSSPEESCRRKG